MNKLVILLLSCGLSACAFGMGGAPVFTVGHKMTGMTVEATRTEMAVNSPSSTIADDKLSSDRVMLTARYGVLPNAEFAVQIGAANLEFGDLPRGYGPYEANWALAWGGEVRAGYPGAPDPYQALIAIKYFGFQPEATTSSGPRTIETKYLWHEIVPTLTAGYALGAFVPYAGIAKPYLFGAKDVRDTFNGQELPALGGRQTYSDGEQSIRGILGLEWRGSDGYLVTGETAMAAGGLWSLSIGISQVLK